MYRFLAGKIKLTGLSKSKIIIVCVIIVSILITMAFTSGTSDESKEKVQTDNSVNGNYIKSTNDNDVNNLMVRIGEHKIESVLSTAESPVINEKINTDQNVESVPDINTVEETKFKNSQIISMYNSPRGKSLIYSMKPPGELAVNTGLNNENTEGVDITNDNNLYEVKAGSVIPSVMINGLNSQLPGSVIALVRANVYDTINRTYLLIPQGSRLVGKYDNNVVYAQDRVAVAWNRLIYPDGSSTDLKALPGTDIEGYSGFYDQVNNHYFRLFGASFIMGVITGAMQYSQNSTGTATAIGTAPTVGQTMAGSLGQQLGQTGLAITQKNLNAAPTIIIRPNYPFNIIITADLRLKPFATVKEDE